MLRNPFCVIFQKQFAVKGMHSNHGYISTLMLSCCYRHMEKAELTPNSFNNPTYNPSLKSNIPSISKQGT